MPISSLLTGLGWTDLLNDGISQLQDDYPDRFDWLSQFSEAPGASPFDGPVSFGQQLPINSPVAAREASEPVKATFGDTGWLESLFNTAEQSAINQAKRNEDAAYAAWLRSEEAADNALRRARELNQTYYQDTVASLKAAGLNPVLAAGGGIGGHSVTAPQANAPASSSGLAQGINGADLLTSIAAIISSAGNLMKGISSFLPSSIISQVTGNYTGNYTNLNESHIYNHKVSR